MKRLIIYLIHGLIITLFSLSKLIEGFLYFLLSDSMSYGYPVVNPLTEFIKLTLYCIFLAGISFLYIHWSREKTLYRKLKIFTILLLNLITTYVFIRSFKTNTSLYFNARSLSPIIIDSIVILYCSVVLFKSNNLLHFN